MDPLPFDARVALLCIMDVLLDFEAVLVSPGCESPGIRLRIGGKEYQCNSPAEAPYDIGPGSWLEEGESE